MKLVEKISLLDNQKSTFKITLLSVFIPILKFKKKLKSTLKVQNELKYRKKKNSSSASRVNFLLTSSQTHCEFYIHIHPMESKHSMRYQFPITKD